MPRVLPIVISLLLLAGCVGANVATPEDDSSRTAQIEKLEKNATQLRRQYEAMGRTIARMEAELQNLKSTTTAKAEPQPVAAKPVAPVAVAAAEETKPTQLVPQAAALTSGDLDIKPEAPALVQAASAEPKPQPEVIYLLHVASYLEASQVKPGWRQVLEQHSAALAGLKPYVTAYQDTRRHDWLRVSAGPFATAEEAQERCKAYKASGNWCDVLSSTKQAARPLN